MNRYSGMFSNKCNVVLIVMLAITFPAFSVFSQTSEKLTIEEALKNLSLRSIGPAVMGGRIADIAVSSTNPSTWYVAAGSGNLWKTTNSGITWKPIFDDQASYSIGAVTLDPQHSEIIWVGTGENVSGRHVAWGDGVYRSMDGGKSWKNMGITRSEHIGKILVDPRNSNTVLVAAEGPLWSSGGDRGVFKTVDGGKTWKLVLEIDENTGVTDLEFDPSNPDVIYAAAYQRRRHVWSLLAGGPKSGIYKSTNNGDSWRQLKTGLPKSDMGKIGLAVSPANPDLVYATIEANDEDKGCYRSLDKGESWEKRSSYISGGTGPHYYQEIEVSPYDPDLIYQMDVFLHVSRNGGKTFDYLETGHEKHSDNHALWIDPKNGNHLLVGTDAGLYESFDEGLKWRHFPNLPISQFYKLGLDNSEPFFNIIGGAQDLGTLIGPSRTLNHEGVRNQDWYVPLGADGYDSHFDPTDPNIAYMEYQQGILHRYDKQSGEVLNIQPQPAPNDPPERWNWDSPVLISPHNNERLYFGSQRLWRSEDKGNSWRAVSGDLTTNKNRYELEMIARTWSVDALYDNGAMSKYATLTAIAESPMVEDLLYTGSDDGLIHVSDTGGQSWTKCVQLPGVPDLSFINDLEASNHDPNTVFAVADAHKIGDFSPYIFMSTNQGRSWKSISGDLPKGTIVWVLKQDYIDENLLFAGTEFGLYFSYNKGTNWVRLKGGVPTISFRDIEIHQRDSDLVGATFGRGFYVLDDYSPLREINKAVKSNANELFPVRDAWWYVPFVPMQAKGMPTLGSDSYVAENPPFGAIFTYYLQDFPKTAKKERQDAEKNLMNKGGSVPFPGWENLWEESLESEPMALLLVKDKNGNPIRWIKGANEKGLHRTNWDLRLPAPNPINLATPAFKPPWADDPTGPLCAPGTYTVELFIEHNGTLTSHGDPQEFKLKPILSSNIDAEFRAVADFQQKTSELMRQIYNASQKISEANEQLGFIKAALKETPKVSVEHFSAYHDLVQKLNELQRSLWGDPIRDALNESRSPSIGSRVMNVIYGHWGTRKQPTKTFKENIEMASLDFGKFSDELRACIEDMEKFESKLDELGSPYTKGRDF